MSMIPNNLFRLFKKLFICFFFQFNTLTRGFEVTSIPNTLLEITSLLKDRSELYSGEGEPIVTLLMEMLTYINNTSLSIDFNGGNNYFFEAVDSLLHFSSAIIHKEVIILNNFV